MRRSRFNDRSSVLAHPLKRVGKRRLLHARATLPPHLGCLFVGTEWTERGDEWRRGVLVRAGGLFLGSETDASPTCGLREITATRRRKAIGKSFRIAH